MEAVSGKSSSECADRMSTVLKECAGNAIESSIFRQHTFLNWTVIRSSFLRDAGLKVLVKDGSRKIVEDIVDGCRLQLRDSTVKEIDDIFTSSVEAYKSNFFPSDLKGVVILEELEDYPTRVVREIIKENQYFLYHPPGDVQFIAVIINNFDYIMECLLYMGKFDGESFKFSAVDPMRRILLLGSVGMQPLDRDFQMEKTKCSEIKNYLLNARYSLLDEKKRRSTSKSYLHNFCPMPACLFRVPPIVGDCEISEGSVVELLNVRRDYLIRDKYSPAMSPHFLSASVVSCDCLTMEVKVIDGDVETTDRVHLSEGLLYPVGTATRLGLEIRGQKSNEAWMYMENVGGPEKYDGPARRGFAELLMDDEASPYIRPIVIRNIYDGILAEFSFIDSMESDSMIFPLSNPRLLPYGSTKWNGLPVRYNHSGLNILSLERVFSDVTSDHVADITVDNLLSNSSEMGDGKNVEPSSVHEDMIDVETVDENCVYLGDMEGGGGVIGDCNEVGEKRTADTIEDNPMGRKGVEESGEVPPFVYSSRPLLTLSSIPPREDNAMTQTRTSIAAKSYAFDPYSTDDAEENAAKRDGEVTTVYSSFTWKDNSSPSGVLYNSIKELDELLKTVAIRKQSPIDEPRTPRRNLFHDWIQERMEMYDEDEDDEMEEGSNSATNESIAGGMEMNELITERSRSGIRSEKKDEEERTEYEEEEIEVAREKGGRDEEDHVENAVSTSWNRMGRDWINNSIQSIGNPHGPSIEATATSATETAAAVALTEAVKRRGETPIVGSTAHSPMNDGTEETGRKFLLSCGDRLVDEVETAIVSTTLSNERGDEREEKGEDEKQKGVDIVNIMHEENDDEMRNESREIRNKRKWSRRKTVSESIGRTREEIRLGRANIREMLEDGIPCGSSDDSVEREKNTLDNSSDEVPTKKSRTSFSIANEVGSNMEDDVEIGEKGDPLDPSFNPFELPQYQARKLGGTDGTAVRGGSLRAPFIRESRSTNIQEKLITGDEEQYRIKMESVLKELKLLRFSSDKIVDMDILNRDLLTKFRNPLEWNALEVQLLLDQFDIVQPLKDYVKAQDFDGICFFSLSFKELLTEFPSLDDDSDFNEKMFLFTFIDRIKKIASDASLVFDPLPLQIDPNC